MKTMVVLLAMVAGQLYGQTFHKKIDFASSTFASEMAATPDGGYILAGSSPSGVPGNAALVKIDALGTVQWSKLVMPPSNIGAVSLSSIITTRDGGYAGVGYSDNEGLTDIWIVKFTAKADVQWNVGFGGIGNNYGSSIIQTHDGGYVVAGYSQPDGVYYPAIIKLDSAGAMQWSTAVSGTSSSNIFATAVIELQDSTLLITGREGFTPSAFILKLTAGGKPLWRKVIGTLPCEGWDIAETPDKGFVIGGRQNQSFYVAKLAHDGVIEWTKIINPLGSGMVRTIFVQPDGTLIAAGSFSQVFSSFESDSLAVLTLTPAGVLKSLRILSFGFRFSAGTSISRTTDGGFMMGGYGSDAQVNYSMLFSRFDPSGHTCFMQDHLVSISEGGIVTNSSILTIDGPPWYAMNEPAIVSTTVTVTDLCSSTSVDASPEKQRTSFVLSPNPISSAAELTLSTEGFIPVGSHVLSLRDVLGTEVYRKKQYIGETERITIPVGDLPSGIYTVDLLDPNTFTSVWRGKVVKIK